jgi:hypothetical protein
MSDKNLFVTINKKKHQVTIFQDLRSGKYNIKIRDGKKYTPKPDFVKSLTFNSRKEALNEFASWKNTEVVERTNVRYVRTEAGVFRLHVVPSKDAYGVKSYSCRLLDLKENILKKPKHFPKLTSRSLDELHSIMRKLPGYFEGARGLADVLGTENKQQKEPKLVKKQTYGDIKQQQRDAMVSIAIQHLRSVKCPKILSLPGEFYSDKNAACFESKVRTELNAEIYGLEQDDKVFSKLSKNKRITTFKMNDAEFFKKVGMVFDFLWLDYFGTFSKQQAGFVEALKNKRVSCGGVIALTFCVTDRTGNYTKGDNNRAALAMANDLLKIGSKLGYDLGFLHMNIYKNTDVKKISAPMVNIVLKVN